MLRLLQKIIVKKKLICHINTTFNSRSGSAKRTRKVLDACLDNGYDVLLITGKDNDIDPKTMGNITIEILPELVKAISLSNELIAYKKIQRLLNRYKPVIVHTHLAKAGILGRLAARKTPNHIIHTVHGPTFPKTISNLKRLVFWTLEFYAAKYTNTFIFVGEELKQSFIDARISKTSNSIVINTARDDCQINYQRLNEKNSISLRNTITSDVSTDKKIISYVARLVPGKQQDHAIHVLSKLHKKGFKNTHLILVGKALLESEVQFESQLHALSKKLELDKFIHFLGHRNDAIEIMDVSDAVILPSKYEGLPNIVVEAVLAGTPVVSYDVSGVKEVLGTLYKKLVVKQGDINGMADIISSIFLSSNDFIQGYSLLKERVKRDFSKETMLKNIIKHYKETI